MTSIEFKTKAVDIYNIDYSFSHREVFLPQLFKQSHIKNAQDHRMFSGKVKADILNIRTKMVLREMGIKESLKLNELPVNVKITGSYILNVVIELG